MNAISHTDLRKLLDSRGERFVSIYMPIELPGRENAQNTIRFRKLLETAEAGLIDKGMSKRDTQSFLQAGRELLEKPVFWTALSRGLAVLICEDAMRIWHLPFACDERCVVGKRFHILPLVAWANDIAPYWLLLVSQNHVRLLRATPQTLEEVRVPGLPPSRQEALHYDRREGSYQVHSANPQLRGKESVVFTGQGGSVDVDAAETASFLRMVGKAVGDYLKPRAEPLVFVGVDPLFSSYRQHNQYLHLADKCVSGNPDLYSNEELRRRTWPIVEAMLNQRRDTELAKYWDRVGHARATNRVDEILIAAAAGAVETLFVDPAAHRLGIFDERAERVRLDDTPRHDSEDLVNLAAILVLGHGGQVLTPSAGNVPGGGPMAATLRYAMPAAAAVESATH